MAFKAGSVSTIEPAPACAAEGVKGLSGGEGGWEHVSVIRQRGRRALIPIIFFMAISPFIDATSLHPVPEQYLRIQGRTMAFSEPQI
jgi:hypothetical protein